MKTNSRSKCVSSAALALLLASSPVLAHHLSPMDVEIGDNMGLHEKAIESLMEMVDIDMEAGSDMGTYTLGGGGDYVGTGAGDGMGTELEPGGGPGGGSAGDYGAGALQRGTR